MKFVVPLTMPRMRIDLVPGEIGRERREDRQAPGDRRLETEGRPAAARLGLELGPVMSDDRFVRGDDRLPGAERRDDQRPGRLHPAHQLDDDIGLGIGDDVGGGVGQQVGRQPVPAAPRHIPDGDRDDRERRAIGGDEAVRVVQQSVEDGAPHGACAEHGDAQRRTAHRWGS